MTTSDLAIGRPAAPPRLRSGAIRFLCCAVLCACALPALALEAAPVAAQAASVATTTVASNAIATSTMATTATATAAMAAPIISDPMPLPDRAMMFAGDINRLIGSQPVTAVNAAPPAGTRVQNLLKRALALLGTPYRWGGTGTDGFDCSGLVGYVFRSALGIELPRVSREMATSGELVSDRAELTPGDLVFFGRRGRVNHVGIYVGEGRFLHAPSTGKDVMVSSLDNGYWSGKYMEARRVAGI